MGCTKKLGCGLCILTLGAIGIVTWRYGPWNNTNTENSYSTTDSLTASNTCPGCCNGLITNCETPINQVLFPMVHNSHSSNQDQFIGANNNLPLEEALVAGYRALMVGSCLCDEFISSYLVGLEGDSNLGFCHGSCYAGVRDPMQVLGNIQMFLEANSNEVLIIEFQINDNSDQELRTALNTSGLLNHVYRPPTEYISEWPTLQSLIDANTRLLLFATGDNIQSCKANACLDGILSTKDHIANTDVDYLETCNPQTSGDILSGFFLMNHWERSGIKLPSESKAEVLNSYESLEGRFEKCRAIGRLPSFLVVDFWDVGDVLDFVRDENVRRGGGEVENRTATGEAEEGLDAGEVHEKTAIASGD